jgi:hypothetical protein
MRRAKFEACPVKTGVGDSLNCGIISGEFLYG